MLTTFLVGVALFFSNTADASVIFPEFSPAGDLARITMQDAYDQKDDAGRLFDGLRIPAVEDRLIFTKKLKSPDGRFTLICEKTSLLTLRACRFEVFAGADSLIDTQGREVRYRLTGAAAASLHAAFGMPGETVLFQTGEEPARIRILSSATEFEFAFK